MRFPLRGLSVSLLILALTNACELPSAQSATQSGPSSTYDRKAWKHWIDEDGDCQDARTEVLIAESFASVEFETPRNCEVEAGRWQCPYTGEIIREPHLLDVDHMVPLANAHRSGGDTWDDARRQAYANDLEHDEHLIAVEAGANRSKGDKGPEAWLPPAEESRCTYVRDWVAIKARWDLSMTDAESAAVAAALAACEAGEIPPLPEPTKTAKPNPPPKDEPPKDATKPDGECCRVCKSGKACGDGCISHDASCKKPPGCACDG